MENVKIAQVCGLCAGCRNAIDTTINELKNGRSVTIFKEIVHNKNVNSYLSSLGANYQEDISKLSPTDLIIVRAHGEPPETYEVFEKNGIQYRDCTCKNVVRIHEIVSEYSALGYKTIIIGKYKKTVHPEVYGTLGWAGEDVVLIEEAEDLEKLKNVFGQKLNLVCQTTFNIEKAEKLIAQIENIAQQNNCDLVVNKTLCMAQKVINKTSAELAKQSDVMIVVGGKTSSNSLELFNNVKTICPSVFIEDIYAYKDALKEAGVILNQSTRVGITAGASTMKEELVELKKMIEQEME